MNSFFSTSSLENNNVSRKDCLAHKVVVSMKAKRRKALKLLGYQQLSINTFYKEGKTIVLKSMVEETNPYEFQYLSITEPLYSAIRDTSIIIEGYVRSSFTSMDIRVSRHFVEFTESAEQAPFWRIIRSNQNRSYRNAIMSLRAFNNIIFSKNNEVA